jgi:3-oxoacyl-[acyl-carrier protein] reductase
MDLGLKGRAAIVAAASTGLGFAVAKELAQEGADVAICARTAASLAQAAAKIKQATGREIFWQTFDVTDAAAVQ